ncbi:beta-Ala-His dipeptidase [Anaerosinus sp.]
MSYVDTLNDKDRKILNGVLKQFEKLAAIPRKSGHEKAVSDYLYHWAQQQELKVIQDDTNNIIIDKPATPGYEDLPRVILQGHMDMVCVAEPGKDYNPLQDAIELINDGNVLKAKGTSLGADDGIGVAAALYILASDTIQHGELRVIITTDEEAGMSGASNLESKYLDGAYLINCDSEDWDKVTMSSAGSVNIDVTGDIQWKKAIYQNALKFTLTGMLGGHSGVMIHDNRANAIKIMGYFLYQLKKAEVAFEIADLSGGTARNAIPSTCETILVLDEEYFGRAREVIVNVKQYVLEHFSKEIGFEIQVEKVDMPTKVIEEKIADKIINFICMAQDGVHTMSSAVDGLVESSSNMGLVEINNDQIKFNIFPRTSVDKYFNYFQEVFGKIASLCDFHMNFSGKSPGWPVNENSKLIPLTVKIFEEQNKIPMKKESIHAGLEAGWFSAKNPDLDIISIGPNVKDIHSPQEHLELCTLVPHVKLIIEILKRVKEL